MPQSPDRAAAIDDATEFVMAHSGRRLFGQRKFARRCVEWVADEWPGPDEERVAAVIRRRAKEEYGSVVAAILISVLANLIAKAIVAWWRKRQGDFLVRFSDAP